MADLDVDLAEARENRFAHLLRPIKDMEECFGINLADELKDYLEQLSNVQVAFEGDRPTLVDFAEAAMLIQGSACVFSKKVEYLSALAYKALETIKGRKRQQTVEDEAAAPIAGPRGRNAAAARADDNDTDWERMYSRTWYVIAASQAPDDVRLTPGEGAMPNAGSSVRPPAVLLALEDQGQGGATTGAKGDGDAGVYRLQQCFVHRSGALLLDANDEDRYDEELRYIGPQQRDDDDTLQQLLEPVKQAHVPSASARQQPQQGSASIGPQGAPDPMHTDPVQEEMDMPPADFYDGGDDGGYAAGGGGWGADDENAVPGPDGGVDGAAEMVGLDGAEAGASVGFNDQDGALPQERPQRGVKKGEQGGVGAGGSGDEEEEEADDDEEEFDPWKPLDPNAKGRLPDRPLVVEKPKLPKFEVDDTVLDHLRSALEKAMEEVPGGFPLPEFNCYLDFVRPRGAAQRAEELAKRQAAAKGKGAVLTTAQKRRPYDRTAAAMGPVFEAEDAAAAVAAEVAAMNAGEDDLPDPQAGPSAPYGLDDDDDYGGGGFGGGASDLDDEGPNPMFGGPDGVAGGQEDEDPEACGRLGRLGLWPGAVPPMGPLGGLEDDMCEEGKEDLTYEELCRSHMEKILRDAAAREVQTDLARRVGSWKERIGPALQAEESRPAFDIQDYGERLLKRLAELKVSQDDPAGLQPAAEEAASNGAQHQRPFAGFTHVAEGLESFEVPRMFSAMLQLINNRNVAISKKDAADVPPGDVPDEPFTLQLLSTEMYHRSMGERLAAKPQQQPGAGAAGTQPQDTGADMEGDEENRGTQQPKPKAKKAAGGGRGKAGPGKRAKKAAPLGDANFDSEGDD